MNKYIHDKIESFKKMAKNKGSNSSTISAFSGQTDSLAQVIRSKKDADEFMAELNSVVKR